MPRSRAAQLAAEEADRVEAEEAATGEDEAEAADAADEAGEATTDEDTAEAEPGDETSSMEAIAKSLEDEIARHDAELGRILGAEYDAMQACYTCGGMGAIALEAPKPDPKSERCPECGGHGFFTTESLNPNHDAKTCIRCSGFGWIDRVPDPVTVPVSPATLAVYTPNTSTTYAPPPNNGTPAIPPMPVYDPTTNSWRDPQSGAELVAASVPASGPAGPA